ncbi:uncharacterized protein CDAR_204271 [Caerostris darwini]|uniref:Ig-like domain-containing protein n=1 Tax=Caerostris darwini TaxID=1538125 RepID=A0AAV4UPN2_9ARAC|nr:uncharacterized protein CDAR_204271 [Caerostris darwini]
MLMMDVPSPTTQGESVELICSYELDEDKLYSVKWYKDDVEFYRYVPNDWPPGQFLPLQGVKVDLSKSGSQSVFLRHVDLNSAGTYRCEVSAEAPEFQTVEAEKTMKVFAINCMKPSYIKLECVRIHSCPHHSNTICTSFYEKDKVGGQLAKMTIQLLSSQ